MHKTELLGTSDERIIDEVKRLQYLFGHSKIIRHGLNRDSEQYTTQSVAEHIYNMFTLAEYFLPLEDPGNQWDRHKIHQMILWHDAGELETGDIPTHNKTPSDEKKEAQEREDVVEKMPHMFVERFEELFRELDSKKTVEAKFVWALDRLEAQICLYGDNGVEITKGVAQLSEDRALWYREISHERTKEFPCVNRMTNLVVQGLTDVAYYHKEAAWK